MLNTSMHEFLIKLDRAHLEGAKWVSIEEFLDISSPQRVEAVRRGYVEARGSNQFREYRLVQAGRTALGDNALDTINHLRSKVNGYPAPVDLEMLSNGDMDEFDGMTEGNAEPVEPEISVSVYGEQMGADEVDEFDIEFAEPAGFVPPVHVDDGLPRCTVPGCGQPRYSRYPRCEAHQKEWKRESNQKHRAKQIARKQAAQAKREAKQRQPGQTPIIESAVDYVPVIHPPIDVPPPMIEGNPVGAVRLIARAAVNAIVLLHRVKGN